MKKLLNILTFFIMIGLGVGITLFMVKNKKVAEHQETALKATPASVMTVTQQTYVPKVIAYGNVEPALTFQSKAEISGKVSYVHPQLKQGGSIAKGTVVVRIDPKDYENSLKQTNADLAASRSQLAQIEQEERNTQVSLKIAQANLRAVQRKDKPVQQNTGLIKKNLQLARQNYNITKKNLNTAKRNLILVKREYARLQKLGQQRLIALTQVEAQEQKVLQQEQSILQLEQSLVQQQQAIVQQEQQLAQQDQSLAQQDQNVLTQQNNIANLQGQLRTYASRKANALAQIQRAEQQVKTQTNQLNRTEITMPFDARISSVAIERGEYVGTGGTLFEAINTDGVEIKAELPLQQVGQLLSPLQGQSLHFSASHAQDALKQLDLGATVSLVGDPQGTTWEARVSRISEAVDPSRRTLSIIVAVDKPYDNIVIGERSPLLKGMYVKITLNAPSMEALVIPRKAVHQKRVYVLNEEQKLDIRPIKIQLQSGNDVVIKAGLEAGETIILNDLIPAIPNMPIQAVNQEADS